MPKSPPEPTNLVLEQLRLMRAETNARFDKLDEDIANIKRDLRGLKLNTIAEVYRPISPSRASPTTSAGSRRWKQS